ncbi:MAG: hypothetical protein ABTR92_13255 [Candidatus Accumulibacter phosphatis]
MPNRLIFGNGARVFSYYTGGKEVCEVSDRNRTEETLTRAQITLLEELLKSYPDPIHAPAPRIFELRKKLKDDPPFTIIVTCNIGSKTAYSIDNVRYLPTLRNNYRDRLFTAFTAQSLKLKPERHVPWVGTQEVQIVFATQRAVIGPDGRRLLKVNEDPRRNETYTSDELTGDGAALHQITVCLTRYGIHSKAVPASAAEHAFKGGRPIFVIGGPYSNTFLSSLEQSELDDAGNDKYGARFDMGAPLRDHKNRITLYHPPGTELLVKELAILDGTQPPPDVEYAVIRRWLAKAPYRSDALLVAGITAQGTAAAAWFIGDDDFVSELYRMLESRGVKDETWEWVQWDAVLEIRLTDGRWCPHSRPKIVAVVPRYPLPTLGGAHSKL